MNLTTLTVADLKDIQKLLEQRESIQAEIEKINAQLVAYEVGAVASAPVATRPARAAAAPVRLKAGKGRRAKRGALKARILELVQAAGKGGITVKDLAGKLGLNYNRVYTWFYKTGKSVPALKKVGEAEYAWVGATPAASPAAPATPASEPAAKPAPVRAARAKPAKRGELKEAVLNLLKTTGKPGMGVKDIAARLGAKPKNIYVWFTSTGKSIKEIKRVGPAKYAWAG
jgi:transposase-like protein